MCFRLVCLPSIFICVELKADKNMVASWTFAKKGMDGNKMPQTIAHRGYKAKFPENTMASMRGAVEVGVDALETDVHLTKDGEVVISHVSNTASGLNQNQKD